MEKVQVSICDRTYNLMTDDGFDYINSLAKKLESQIREYSAQLKRKTEVEVLTLVALNVIDESQKEILDLASKVKSLSAEMESLAKHNQAVLQENVTSAGSEMEQLASVKDKENDELRKKLQEYEQEFERLVDEKEREITKLKESFNSAKGEMEHIALVQDTDNTKLRNTLNSYETTFDLYVKTKEEEITSLRAELEAKQAECDVLRQRLAAVADDGQMTIC